MDESDKIVWCGNLAPNVTEELLFELFLQAGPLEKVTLPKEKDGKNRSYAFVMFKHSVSVPYTIDLLNGVNLCGRPLRLQPRSLSTESPPTRSRPTTSSPNDDRINEYYNQRGSKRQNDSTRSERIHRKNSFSESYSPYHRSRANYLDNAPLQRFNSPNQLAFAMVQAAYQLPNRYLPCNGFVNRQHPYWL